MPPAPAACPTGAHSGRDSDRIRGHRQGDRRNGRARPPRRAPQNRRVPGREPGHGRPARVPSSPAERPGQLGGASRSMLVSSRMWIALPHSPDTAWRSASFRRAMSRSRPTVAGTSSTEMAGRRPNRPAPAVRMQPRRRREDRDQDETDENYIGERTEVETSYRAAAAPFGQLLRQVALIPGPIVDPADLCAHRGGVGRRWRRHGCVPWHACRKQGREAQERSDAR